MKNHFPLKTAAALAAVLITSTSCSDAPPKPAASVATTKEPASLPNPAPPNRPIGRCIRRFGSGRKMSNCSSMGNHSIREMKGGDGKEAAWEAVFVSATKTVEARKVVYSVKSTAARISAKV